MKATIEQFKATIRNVPDFPKPGIQFKDITPVLAQPVLCRAIAQELAEQWRNQGITAVAGIEARGFIFGAQLALLLDVPFIPIRKAGKLPFHTFKVAYSLEYGEAELEMHRDAVSAHDRVLIHDDLLATGGTAEAAAQLINQAGGVVSGFSFLIELEFLKGRELLSPSAPVHTLVTY